MAVFVRSFFSPSTNPNKFGEGWETSRVFSFLMFPSMSLLTGENADPRDSRSLTRTWQEERNVVGSISPVPDGIGNRCGFLSKNDIFL